MHHHLISFPTRRSSDLPVADEVVRRDRNNRWLNTLEYKVSYIQKRIPIITDERERAVLECMLDGMSMMAIGKHMGLSRQHIYRIKESILLQMLHFGQNVTHVTENDKNNKKELNCYQG